MLNFAKTAETITIAAGKLILDAFNKGYDLEIKSDSSPVTTIDKTVEQLIRSNIMRLYPHHGIKGEEFEDYNPDAEFIWVIDPIDGTLAFISGIPVFGSMVALLHGDDILVSAIEMPMTNERWLGRIGMPSLHNGKPIRTRNCHDMSNALMSTSNPDFYSKDNLKYLEIMQSTTKYRIYGGSCMSYLQLASGRIDIGMDVAFDIYDYLPLVPIIEGAGGIITDWNGDKLTLNSGDRFVACGDRNMHEQTLKILNIK